MPRWLSHPRFGSVRDEPAGVRDSGRGRTGPDSLADFTDVIWINATSGERELPF